MGDAAREMRVEAFRQLLAREGYRVTPQRLAIYEALVASPTHPSAEELYRRVRERYPMISPATVYNTLQLLVRLGLATELGFHGETRYDGNPQAHANLLCLGCRRIYDLEEELLDRVFDSVRRRSGFVLLGQRHEFLGICPQCRARGVTPEQVLDGAAAEEEATAP